MQRSRSHLESKSPRVYGVSRKLTLEQRIYNDILHILCLYENEDVYFIAAIAAQTIYKNIKNYIKENNNE